MRPSGRLSGFPLPRWIAVGVATCLAPSCGGGEPERPWNALVVTLDTTRADALGFAGRSAPTPARDSIAEEALVYDAARTTAPLTRPSHVSMFTGLYPPRHGVRDNAAPPLPGEIATQAERAREAGYETATFVAAVVLDRSFALDQGFETWGQPPRPLVQTSASIHDRPAAEDVAEAHSWLARRDRSRPFFIWVHLFDPHAPYAPPRAHAATAGGDPYLGEVAAMDAALAPLFADLRESGAWDRTYAVVVADHGEALGEHGEAAHRVYTYATTMRVPLLVRDPGGWSAAERTDEVVSVADVNPTLVDALGLGALGDVDGVSLHRRAPPEGRGVYFENYAGYLAHGWAPLAGWADAEATYVHGPAPLVFEGPRGLGAGERVAPDAPEWEAHRAAIADVVARPRVAADGGGGDVRATMQALGYAGVGAGGEELPSPLDNLGLPDPHARKDELARSWRAAEMADAGRHEEAIAILRQVVAANPRNAFALDRLGHSLLALGRHEEAIEPLERFLAVGPDWPGTRYELGNALFQVGREERAIEELRAVVSVDPGHVQALNAQCKILRARERPAEAEEYCERLRDAQRFDHDTGFSSRCIRSATARAPSPRRPPRP